MSTALRIEAAGLGVTVQDRGRFGHRRIGVPISGALDPLFLAAANALVGNPPDCTALEISVAGPTLKAIGGPIRVGLVGAVEAQVIDTASVRRPLPSWSTATLRDGERLRIGTPRGVAYLAIAGGIAAKPELGSCATYARAGLSLLPEMLVCVPFSGDSAKEWTYPSPFEHEVGPIRVMTGPQIHHFDAPSLQAFGSAAFHVTRERDRMGLRLAGPTLGFNALGADIISDGVTPGAIQVPADGRPIVLLADCQTVGGYPKIAVVIRADLPRLAHVQPGDALHFRFVDRAEAAVARQQQAARFTAWLATLQPRADTLDSAHLLAANLAGAAVRGDEPHA